MKRHFVTALFFIAAVIFYALGAVGPGIIFLLLGGLAELGFWLRLFRRGK